MMNPRCLRGTVTLFKKGGGEKARCTSTTTSSLFAMYVSVKESSGRLCNHIIMLKSPAMNDDDMGTIASRERREFPWSTSSGEKRVAFALLSCCWQPLLTSEIGLEPTRRRGPPPSPPGHQPVCGDGSERRVCASVRRVSVLAVLSPCPWCPDARTDHHQGHEAVPDADSYLEDQERPLSSSIIGRFRIQR